MRRDHTIDRYTVLRKKQAIVDTLLRYVHLRLLLRYLSNNYAIAQYKKEKKLKAQLLIVKIRHILKRRRLKWMFQRNHECAKKSKFLCTVLGNAFHETY